MIQVRNIQICKDNTSQYKYSILLHSHLQDDDQEAGMCTSIFTADILNKYPDGVTVWGIQHIKTFNIQVDNDNKRVGLNQPA